MMKYGLLCAVQTIDICMHAFTVESTAVTRMVESNNAVGVSSSASTYAAPATAPSSLNSGGSSTAGFETAASGSSNGGSMQLSMDTNTQTLIPYFSFRGRGRALLPLLLPPLQGGHGTSGGYRSCGRCGRGRGSQGGHYGQGRGGYGRYRGQGHGGSGGYHSPLQCHGRGSFHGSHGHGLTYIITLHIRIHRRSHNACTKASH